MIAAPFCRTARSQAMMRRSHGPAAVLAAFALTAAGCLGSMCGDTELYKSTSPSGTRSVKVLTRDCGATTGVSTLITERQGWFGRQVVLLAIDGDASAPGLLTIGWVDETEFVISLHSAFSIRPATPFPSDLKVGYAPGTRLGS